MYVVGFRLGMIVAGGLALALSDHVPWSVIYASMGALMLVSALFTWIAPTNPRQATPRTLEEAVVAPITEFLARPGARVAVVFLLLYKFGDGVVLALLNAFLIDAGFSGKEIGITQQVIGIAATILGVVVGGALLDRFTLRRGLLWFGACQAGANAGYVVLALIEPGLGALVVATTVDSLCTGLATAAFVACITALCDTRYSATQYALFTAITSLLAHTLGAFAGWFVDTTHWAVFFAVSGLVTLPALFLVGKLPLATTPDPVP
jgi:PAT family beta-lactamase induction signal transducer AmpG